MNTFPHLSSDIDQPIDQARRSIEVVAAAILDGNRVLAAQRGYGKWKGWWEFPGGKVEANETHQQALQREIREELDSDLVVDQFCRTIRYRYPEFDMTMHLYFCHLSNGIFTLKEHLDARWLAQSELQSVKWLPADIELINEWMENGICH